MGICQIIIGVVVLMIIIIKIKTIGTIIIIIIIIIIMAVFGSGIFTFVGNVFIRGTVRRIGINDGLMFGGGSGGSVVGGNIFIFVLMFVFGLLGWRLEVRETGEETMGRMRTDCGSRTGQLFLCGRYTDP
jgi:hypothetical protein